jgi:hypothetical protein
MNQEDNQVDFSDSDKSEFESFPEDTSEEDSSSENETNAIIDPEELIFSNIGKSPEKD